MSIFGSFGIGSSSNRNSAPPLPKKLSTIQTNTIMNGANSPSNNSTKVLKWEEIKCNYNPNNPFNDSKSEPNIYPAARTYFSMLTHNHRLFLFGGFGG